LFVELDAMKNAYFSKVVAINQLIDQLYWRRCFELQLKNDLDYLKKKQ